VGCLNKRTEVQASSGSGGGWPGRGGGVSSGSTIVNQETLHEKKLKQEELGHGSTGRCLSSKHGAKFKPQYHQQ
jgi:hypothetical protein